jgi:phage FluMu protein Com
MHMETARYLRMSGTLPTTRIQCPECKKLEGFKVGSGYVSEAKYTRKDTGEEETGFLIFCSDTCALLWPTAAQCGGFQ